MTNKWLADREQLGGAFEYLLEEMNKDNHRAAAIVGSSMMEEILRRLLAGYFLVEGEPLEKLMGSYGPLSDFAKRIDAAYALGLINAEERTELTAIRKIRNQFAHEMSSLSFSHEDIVKEARKLKLGAKGELHKPNYGYVFIFSATELMKRSELRMILLVSEREERLHRMKEIRDRTIGV